MKQLCHGGCRREARVEWAHPTEDSWWLCNLHSLASRDLLHGLGYADFANPDPTDKAELTLTGGPLDADVD